MSIGLTLFKIGMTGAIVAGVTLGARQYQVAQLRRARLRGQARLPALPPGRAPATGACDGMDAIVDAYGNRIGSWATGGEGQPDCVPSCSEGYVPSRTGPGDLEWTCVVAEPEPEQFPVADPCMTEIYSRMPIPPEANLYESASVPTRVMLKDLRLHLDYKAQPEIMLGLLEKIATEPSVRSVMVRRVLEEIAPGCEWWVPEGDMLPSQILAYESALGLSVAAETEKDWAHPVEARKGMIPREYLGMPSTGTLQVVPGQRVELLVVEGPQMRFGEHLIAKVTKGGAYPTAVIVPTFRGVDVAPRFGGVHGFEVGTQVVLESTPPTSVYRVYPQDWT